MNGDGPLDLLVVGSGVAGLTAAIMAAGDGGLRTGLVTKGVIEDATTRWAQGGVAAALGADPEEVDLHLADTLAAGAGLCDPDAARVLVDEGPRRVEELIALGAEFDRDAQGNLELAREGGHSVPRVVHAGGAATGAEIERALIEAVRSTAALLHTGTFLEDLVVRDGRCVGARCRYSDGSVDEIEARNVLLAAGGAGQLYSVTTNPSGATGDGVAASLRAGAAVADLEFFQFHPTALRHQRSPRPLLTEALRGHGAVLRNGAGDRFVDELLPRDVVSRAILTEMKRESTDQVWLDATGLDDFGARFPTIDGLLRSVGLDARVDLLPVHPAAHHQCGGVLTDLDGATTLDGLWACGEVACTGVHGANRLASNSLLEGMVFAPRAVEAIAAGRMGPRPSGAMAPYLEPAGSRGVPLEVLDFEVPGLVGVGSGQQTTLEALRQRLQVAMTTGAGVERSAESLRSVAAQIELLDAELCSLDVGGADQVPVAHLELANLIQVARALVAAAMAREESRGTHWRSDWPDTDDRQLRRLLPTPSSRGDGALVGA
ncbi:MAG: L-aspartate oxidase [Microthrixaceae bacterium]